MHLLTLDRTVVDGDLIVLDLDALNMLKAISRLPGAALHCILKAVRRFPARFDHFGKADSRASVSAMNIRLAP